jgi:hypothetical protein
VTSSPSQSRSPLYEAQNAQRYERQQLIRDYETRHSCRLVVLIDALFADSVTYFEDLLYDADPAADLHVLLGTPGGDGEVALRLLRQAQARCRELTVLVPDQAKSAGTLFVLGAHRIVMGPTSDLGPVDPQFSLGPGKGLAAAKDIIAAVEDAARRVEEAPNTYPLYASLLSDLTALMVEQARAATRRVDDLILEALQSNSSRSPQDASALREQVRGRLVNAAQAHSATISADDADAMGLPVVRADPLSDQWRLIWRMWTKYQVLGGSQAGIYEGVLGSQIRAQR